MAKHIQFTYKDKLYTLEFTRETVVKMEHDGYTITDIDKQPFTYVGVLFRYAFDAHHSGIEQENIDEIYNALGDKEALFARLSEMVADTINSLFDEPKNAVKWEMN